MRAPGCRGVTVTLDVGGGAERIPRTKTLAVYFEVSGSKTGESATSETTSDASRPSLDGQWTTTFVMGPPAIVPFPSTTVQWWSTGAALTSTA